LRESINSWLKVCREKCNFNTLVLEKALMPLRLIDVGGADGSKDPVLIIMPNRKGIYLTLSYRWFENPFKAKPSNWLELCKKIPLNDDKMPQAIKNAITFTRWLGVQYLWVDALCLVQT
jgi:hypothetical protein